MNIVVIIVTKDRPNELHRCLTSIQQQTVQPYSVLVVDGSTTAEPIVQSFGYPYYQSTPGITRQRNVARQHIPHATDIVLYCDDDTVLPPGTMTRVISAFADQSVIGVTGQMRGEPFFGFLKKMIGLFTGTYTTKPYGLSYGLFNIINPFTSLRQAMWLPGAFMAYRWSKVKDIIFDEWFTEYGLGEDFDFSYRVSKFGKLVADPAIQIEHRHSAQNRNWQAFGTMRIVNRHYLLKKFWPRSVKYTLGMWWANFCLILGNGIRGLYSKRYRLEWLGEIKGLTKLF